MGLQDPQRGSQEPPWPLKSPSQRLQAPKHPKTGVQNRPPFGTPFWDPPGAPVGSFGPVGAPKGPQKQPKNSPKTGPKQGPGGLLGPLFGPPFGGPGQEGPETRAYPVGGVGPPGRTLPEKGPLQQFLVPFCTTFWAQGPQICARSEDPTPNGASKRPGKGRIWGGPRRPDTAQKPGFGQIAPKSLRLPISDRGPQSIGERNCLSAP